MDAAELRKVAKRFRRAIVNEHGLPYLLLVADELFRGEVLEEKAFAVYAARRHDRAVWPQPSSSSSKAGSTA